MKKNVIFGTAGHIDHGKSSLVKALTGSDPDRLAEEKKRGITIDLGFAHMENEQCQVSFVDVPGHEKLVKNMIAGATGFDAVLFAVDANESIKPQTVEHLNIIKNIGVKTCIVAITKSDLVDEEKLKMTMLEVEDLFSDAGFFSLDFIPVSIHNSDSLVKIKELVFDRAYEISGKDNAGDFVLRIDRKFSVKGFGTVVTGTVISGSAQKGETLKLLPDGIEVKIKGLNVHSEEVERVYAGQRAAVNISDVDTETASRGKILVSSSNIRKSCGIYGYVQVFDNINSETVLRHNKTYRLYAGTSQREAKLLLYNSKSLSAGEGDYCFLRLDEPYTYVFDETFLIRSLSPVVTVAGGQFYAIEEIFPDRKNTLSVIEKLGSGKINEAYKKAADIYPQGFELPSKSQGGYDDSLKSSGLVEIDGLIFDNARVESLKQQAVDKLSNDGVLKQSELTSELGTLLGRTVFKFVEEKAELGFESKGGEIKKKTVSPFEQKAMTAYEVICGDWSISNPVQLAEKIRVDAGTAGKIFDFLTNRDYTVKLEKNVYVTKKMLDQFYSTALKKARSKGFVELSDMKSEFDLTRKLLVPLMDYLDRTGKFVNKDRKRYLK